MIGNAARGSRNAATALLLAFALVNVAAAQSPVGPKLVDVHIGFDGAYKLGYWTAVQLEFAGGAEAVTGKVVLTTVDGDDVPVRYSSDEVTLQPGGTTRVVVYAKFGRREAGADVAFVVGDRQIFGDRLETKSTGLFAPLDSNARLIVCLGDAPSLGEAAAVLDLDRSQFVVATIADPTLLPTRSLAYDGVDAVVVVPVDAAAWKSLSSGDARIAALSEWLTYGGRAWIAVSDAASSLFVAGGALHDLAAVGEGPGTALPRTSELEKFAGGDRQPVALAEFRRKPLMIPRVSTVDAVVESAEGNLPLVVRRAFGLGTVVVTSFHPEHPLLASWLGRSSILNKLLNRVGLLSDRELAVAEGKGAMPATRDNHGNFGYEDLAGQLRSSLDDYEGVQVVSFFALAMMVIGFLALVGPVDYWFVHRVLRRPEITWITFPTIVVVTSLSAYFVAVRLKGTELRVHRADVVDCDAATGAIRTTSWAGVFSPVGQKYDVRFEPASPLVATADTRAVTSWFGLPGSGLGGMDAGGAAPVRLTPSYSEATDDAALTGVPIQVWSSKMFAGRRTAKSAKNLHAPLSTVGDDRLHGAVRNPFSVEVRGAVLCYGPRAYEVGDLKAGESRDVGSLTVRDLQLVLQDWQVVLSANKNPLHVGRPHDPGGRQVEEILRKMMFYTSAGSEEHANLENRYLSSLDLSALVSLRRAVLVGRIDPTAVGELTVDAVDDATVDRAPEARTAFVRLAIPVSNN